MAVYWGTRYALPRVRIFWVRSASSTYMKYPSSKPPTALKAAVSTAEKLPVQNSISVGFVRSLSAIR